MKDTVTKDKVDEQTPNREAGKFAWLVRQPLRFRPLTAFPSALIAHRLNKIGIHHRSAV
jgi:hypothetical protein